MRNSKTGLVVLLAKLGPKLLTIAAKIQAALWPLLKSLVGIKTAGIVASIGLYAYLFTWQMGVAIVAFLAIHEYGHLWAMQRTGMRVRGMYFIPGFGAVAITEDKFGNARNEAFIALLGPLFGLLFFVFPAAMFYLQTNNPMWAAIAGFTGFVNMVNLLPVLPLDGGHVLKALAYSENKMTSFFVTVLVSVAAVTLAWYLRFNLVIFLAFVGFFEIAGQFGLKERINKFTRTIARFAMSYLLYISIDYAVFVAQARIDTSPILNGVDAIALCVLFICLALDIWSSTYKVERSVLVYPLVVVGDVGKGIMQVLNLRTEHIKPIEHYEFMSSGSRVLNAVSYVLLVGVHLGAIYALSKVPGAEFVGKFLE
jgi:Zn-dependent protease